MSLNSISPYSVASEKAIAAQRAADVRKKLIKSPSTPEEDLFIGQWVTSDQNQLQTPGQHHAALSGRDPDFG